MLLLLLAAALASPFTEAAATIEEAWKAGEGERVAAFCAEEDSQCSDILQDWASRREGGRGRLVEREDAALLEMWVDFPFRSGEVHAPMPMTLGLEHGAKGVRITSLGFQDAPMNRNRPLPPGLNFDGTESPLVAHAPPVLQRWMAVSSHEQVATPADTAMCSDALQWACTPDQPFEWVLAKVQTSSVDRVTVAGAAAPVTTRIETVEAIVFQPSDIGPPRASRVVFQKEGDDWLLVDLSTVD